MAKAWYSVSGSSECDATMPLAPLFSGAVGVAYSLGYSARCFAAASFTGPLSLLGSIVLIHAIGNQVNRVGQG